MDGVGAYKPKALGSSDTLPPPSTTNMVAPPTGNTSSGVMTRTSGSGMSGIDAPQYNAYGQEIDPITGEIVG